MAFNHTALRCYTPFPEEFLGPSGPTYPEPVSLHLVLGYAPGPQNFNPKLLLGYEQTPLRSVFPRQDFATGLSQSYGYWMAQGVDGDWTGKWTQCPPPGRTVPGVGSKGKQTPGPGQILPTALQL